LRRAAERRQAKIAQERRAAQGQAAGRPANKSRPEYSDRKAERRVRRPEDDEVLVAEIVGDTKTGASAPARKQRAETQKERSRGQYDASRAQPSVTTASAAAASAGASAAAANAATSAATAARLSGGDPVRNLLLLFRQTGGIQQAILLKEILDRPVHRW
jgi:hypothetical protein